MQPTQPREVNEPKGQEAEGASGTSASVALEATYAGCGCDMQAIIPSATIMAAKTANDLWTVFTSDHPFEIPRNMLEKLSYWSRKTHCIVGKRHIHLGTYSFFM